MSLTAQVTADLLARYDRAGPRYTSYPTAVEFSEEFGPAEYRKRLAAAAERTSEPLSLYAHVPFCSSRCSFCACTVLITRNPRVSERYLGRLLREIELVAPLLGERRRVAQLHWGGGTPTYLDPEQIGRLFGAFREHFEFEPDAEIALEVDPRVTVPEQMELLRELGFNRISMGVQDFDARVQTAINRIQPLSSTRNLVNHARELGFGSVNLDLVYGLPHQTEEGFLRTIDEVVSLRPDRLAVYSFAMVPWLKRNQRLIDQTALPEPAVKLRLYGHAREKFLDAGYRIIGMDHFALPEDELSVAAENRALHRNFMGYATRPAPDMVGFGMSSIGEVSGAFVQNQKRITRWEEMIDAGELPVHRGFALNEDDHRRRAVILDLMCNFHVDRIGWEDRFGLSFDDTFARELEELTAPDGPVDHGFVEVGEEGIDVTEMGTLFVRNLAMIFDSYRREKQGDAPVFSRTV
ncbi:MAG: oxygen-independent coproporphyrinogen III oxidase [Planctomycetota bacterium]|jgi:oxygen-independent coproporphyrinogen-3 oxidase